MRLLNVHTLDIETFDQPEEKYAILSHRWGKSEVKFVDLPDAKGEINEQLSEEQPDDPTTGTAKIAKACFQCRELQLKYLWIDTCCIDKRSSTEESESINSMFNWYNEAEICLAYLADVGEAPHQKFSDSVWFTRGWTLQELLASRNVFFFDREWTEIGTKTSLSSEIERASRISHEHLIDFRTACIATRMSWQAGRTTTRTEDLAYSLFGIFDVAMDLRYGEREKSFRRLQEEIINRYPLDESILAWEAPGADKRGGVLAPNPSCFKNSAHLTVTSPIHRYRPREVYRVSNKGLEISVPFVTNPLHYLIGNPAILVPMLKKAGLTLNCWKEGQPSPATVVIQLKKDDRGFFQRTNCDKLNWAKAVSRTKTWDGMPLTAPIPVQL